ncbi:substrate-binding periplasmic protein [Parachitinimonas caeni]|uniref:Solute-binding protein family 3/N-terminal domain-containing protein n=1 Tax=Parachitinimonas caeni TaxID=3031301 RepID=A0ABT7E1F1_9NEIS|nr:hypothetical protein [Parachitinimonas caeni]MDK2126137.1 hypothetical protein [Parachitinimonas caeni]
MNGAIRVVLVYGMLAGQTFACEIRFALGDDEAMPYRAGAGPQVRGDKPGIALELVEQASQAIDCKAVFTRLPSKRVLAETISGRFDGSFMYSYDPDRARELAYPMKQGAADGNRRIATLSYYLYRRKDSPVDWDGKQISGVVGNIGVNLGWSISKDLAAKGHGIEEALGSQQNFSKLAMGRIGAYATQDIDGDYLLAAGKFPQIERLPQPLNTKHYFVVFNQPFARSKPDLVENFWTQLGLIREKQFGNLLKRYQAND